MHLSIIVCATWWKICDNDSWMCNVSINDGMRQMCNHDICYVVRSFQIKLRIPWNAIKWQPYIVATVHLVHFLIPKLPFFLLFSCILNLLSAWVKLILTQCRFISFSWSDYPFFADTPSSILRMTTIQPLNFPRENFSSCMRSTHMKICNKMDNLLDLNNLGKNQITLVTISFGIQTKFGELNAIQWNASRPSYLLNWIQLTKCFTIVFSFN